MRQKRSIFIADGLRYVFPTIEEVRKASKEELATWYRFAIGTTAQERKTLQLVRERLKKLGVIDEKLSKKIGH